MKRTLLLITLTIFLLNCSLVKITIANVEKSSVVEYGDVTAAAYNRACNTVPKIFANNKLYMAVNKKSKKTAYYYGCDGSGRVKATIYFTYGNDQILTIQIDTLVEGEAARVQAENIANDLKNRITNEFDALLKKPNKFIFF